MNTVSTVDVVAKHTEVVVIVWSKGSPSRTRRLDAKKEMSRKVGFEYELVICVKLKVIRY